MAHILMTGFPGFLGCALLPLILRRRPDENILCVVQEHHEDFARQRLAELTEENPDITGRVDLVPGDITVENLDIDPEHFSDMREMFHLAAVYDLAVSEELAYRVNVDGTANVIQACEQAPEFRRLNYVSTCYVSGRYTGPFGEDDLDVGQHFDNFYEETKFLAEVEVRARRAGGLPTTVYRPAIVVGDSTNGETQKYDGPYFALQWLLRQPKALAVLPVIGDPTASRFNIVPRDFVTEAIVALSADERSKDRTYQLADPRPLTVDELYREMGRATGRRVLRVPLTRRLAKLAIEKLPGVYQVMRIPSDAVDYLTLPTHYLSANTQADLDGTGVGCPPLPSYLPTLVDFMRRHPDVGSAAMV